MVNLSARAYRVTRCASVQSVQVVGVDARGYYIIGRGAPTSTLYSNSKQLAKSRPKSSSAGDVFDLTLRKPVTNNTVDLAASIKPLRTSGAKTIVQKIAVTFDDDVCPVVTEYTVPTANSEPEGITAGSDGALWFTEYRAGQIGRITTSGSFKEYTIPDSYANAASITSGSDGALSTFVVTAIRRSARAAMRRRAARSPRRWGRCRCSATFILTARTR